MSVWRAIGAEICPLERMRHPLVVLDKTVRSSPTGIELTKTSNIASPGAISREGWPYVLFGPMIKRYPTKEMKSAERM